MKKFVLKKNVEQQINLKYLAVKHVKINEDKKIKVKEKENVCIYKTNFITATFNRSMKYTFPNKSEGIK